MTTANSPAGRTRSADTVHPPPARAAASPIDTGLNAPLSSVTSSMEEPPDVLNTAGSPAIAYTCP